MVDQQIAIDLTSFKPKEDDKKRTQIVNRVLNKYTEATNLFYTFNFLMSFLEKTVITKNYIKSKSIF